MPRLRVLIAAFDGLQPAQITAEGTPTIHALAARGVVFTRHHAVFPTVTRVNAASMVTGVYPGRHGLLGNTAVFPELDPFRPMAALEPALRRLAAVAGGRVLLAPTLGERLAAAGLTFGTVVGGTSGNAYVQHPEAARVGGAVLHAEFALPDRLHGGMIQRTGPWPPKRAPEVGRIARVGDALLQYLLPEIDPDVALVWFPEPDTSQHASGVGSEVARQALAAADLRLRQILEALARASCEPDVLVVSDHGYSTIARHVDIDGEVRAAGFPTGERRGGVAVAPNGAAALFYVHESAPDAVARLGDWLRAQPWAGALVGGRARDGESGVLPGELAGVAGPRAPDLVMSFRWDPAGGAPGLPGCCDAADGQPGQGTHGSGSPQELRCTLVAAGPSFREGVSSDLPSGNVDLTPTVLRLLGIDDGGPFDGRPLLEAFRRASRGEAPVLPRGRRVIERSSQGGTDRLILEEVGSTRYVAGLERNPC
jgi:arylsulfatase A-like enzyme